MGIKYQQLHDIRALTKLIRKYGSDDAIARVVGCHSGTVTQARRKMGLKKLHGGQPKYPLLYDHVALRVMMDECSSYTELAHRLGCSENTALWACRRGGVKLPRTEKENTCPTSQGLTNKEGKKNNGI